MIKIIYENNESDIFEIYYENESDIEYKDHAQNLIKMNKSTLKCFIFITNMWVYYDSHITSYEKLKKD